MPDACQFMSSWFAEKHVAGFSCKFGISICLVSACDCFTNDPFEENSFSLFIGCAPNVIKT